MSAKAKTINLLLYDGSLQGVISIEDSSWNSGEMYCAPRDSVEDLLAIDACSKYGVYLLLSNNKVYVGQSSDLARRLAQHINGKDWWDSALILTTKDDSLNHTDIDYLESILIEKAQIAGKLDCDNGNKGNPRKVDRFREVFLGQYLDEALFLMQLIGITVFMDDRSSRDSSNSSDTFVVNTMDSRMRLKFGTRAKSEAVKFAKEHGIEITANVSYSKLQVSGSEYWINPRQDCLASDWSIILNDNQSNQLVVLCVPADTLTVQSDVEKALALRTDKPELIDLHISREELIDKKSGIDFSLYLVDIISY